MDLKVDVYKSDSVDAPQVVLLCYDDGEGAKIYEALKKISDAPLTLIAVSGLDWNNDMSPWPSKAVFKGMPDFGGKSGEFLEKLIEMLPEASIRYICGYSMAGLFALWALYNCDLFDGAASCSGLLWYPKFDEYIRGNEPKKNPQKIYMSLGDREAKTRNPVMATVEDKTLAIFEHFKAMGIETRFEMNQGNHFAEPDVRTAKGIAWLLSHLSS